MRNGIDTSYLQKTIFFWLADCSWPFNEDFVPLVNFLESYTPMDRYKFEMGVLHIGFGSSNCNVQAESKLLC